MLFKSMVKTLTVVLAVSFSAHAMAEEIDAMDREIAEGKIQAGAAVASQGLHERAANLVQEIATLQDEVGQRNEDSQGVLKALGEKLMLASQDKKRMDIVMKAINDSVVNPAGLDVVTAYDIMNANYQRIFDLNQEARALVGK